MSLISKIQFFSKNNKTLIAIIIFGGILRLSFLLYGAELYFDRKSIFFNSDTKSWQVCFENLLNIGTFGLDSKNGFFCRMPGFSFYIGIFYLISNKSWDLAMPLVGYFQTFLDIFTIYLFYKLSMNFFNKGTSLIAALLYSFYPFIIVWNPVAYAELISNFFLILTLFYFFKSKSTPMNYFLSGILIALASLTRPQVLPLSLFLILSLLFKIYLSRNNESFKNLILFCFSFFFLFGSWPLRNYINHDRLIITKNAEGYLDWQEDVISFMQFIYSVKTDWDPQYSSIVRNKPTTFPNVKLDSKQDSLLLKKAIHLCKNCGSGFSNKLGYWKSPIKANAPNCNKEISNIFNELRNKQIKNHPINFYLFVPLKNLKKAIFKNKLYDNKSNSRMFASSLFYLRTFLIILGLIGLIFLLKTNKNLSIIILCFFITVYFTLCFGTKPFMRNIEIRYFLFPDVLLLLPGAYFIHYLLFLKLKFFQNQ